MPYCWLLARNGFEVDAIDILRAGLDRARQAAERQGLRVNWIEHDLDQAYPFAGTYDLIVIMWYVDLELIGNLCDCLAPCAPPCRDSKFCCTRNP